MSQQDKRYSLALVPVFIFPLMMIMLMIQNCGNSGGIVSGGDGGIGPDGGARADGGVAPDGGARADGGVAPDGGARADGGACQYSGFTPVDQEAWYELDEEGDGIIEYYGFSNTDYPTDVMGIENWLGFGGPDTLGTYEFTEDDLFLDSCGFCVLISKGCTDDETCGKYFMPQGGGTYTLTSLGTTDGSLFSGTLNNVVFQEVDIDWDTGLTEPVSGGETWCVNSYTWNAEVSVEITDGGN